jgi:hypothetical protein
MTLQFNPPVDDAPQKRTNKNGRPGFPEVEIPLTALVPPEYLVLTLVEHPTFWYYIPYSTNDLESANLVIQDERQIEVYEKKFTVINTPGITSLCLPETAPFLEIDQKYRIDFSLFGNKGGESRVKIWIKRVRLDPDLRSQLEAATTPRERYVIYAANSLWQDALTELAKLRLANPQDEEIAADWETLLGDPNVDLDEIASKPLVSYCTSEE